jgi:small subunit ribosomal protein S8
MVNNSLNFMFSLINNASVCNKGDIRVPNTKKNLRVLSVLYREGLIRGFVIENVKNIIVHIKFTGSVNKPVIRHIQSISTNGRPFWANVKTLSKLAHTNEIFLITTAKGVLTLSEALLHNVGGFIFCKII